jgi:hypothetical protein
MDAREALGYLDSSRFIAPDKADELPASDLTFALRVALSECPKLGSQADDIRFEGAYVLQREPQAPAVPVVYVVRTASETMARKIHRFVWNQNQSPFLILESPSTILIYTGFTYERDGEHPLLAVAKDAADALTSLADFRAQSIDDGTLWNHWAHAIDPAKRVNEALLRDLASLDQRLQGQGVGRRASHGLIGKFVYLRYLRDREILSNKKLAKWSINPDHLFTATATLKAFRQVNDELQGWLNGAVFSLGDAELSHITEPQLQLVAGVFRGGSPVGKDEFQPSLFDAYNFSHIPIETLSCVYEQFLHGVKEADGSSRGRTLGAYYTPLPLADYVLSEMERQRPLKSGMRVLDPACGSGAFLVQCYRRLIEKQRRLEGRELKKVELRELLTRHIFGIDRDDDACRIAELSLILTLLDYVAPPDLEDTTFKLPSLRGRNVFGPTSDAEGNSLNADFFDDEGPVQEFLARERFDWIVGNPPWAEVKGTPSADHEHYVAHQWMKAHKTSCPTSGNQIAEAFLWKSGQHLEAEGICGMVVLAMTWFKKEATTFRQRFFSERRVWCLANFANLAYALFAGRSERPASVVFFDCQAPDADHLIQSFAPFVSEQVANRPEKPTKRAVTWNILVSGNDVCEVENARAISGDSLTWKLAMWGTSRDRKLLERLGECLKDEKFESLERLGIATPHEGLQLRERPPNNEQAEAPSASSLSKRKKAFKHYPELAGKSILRISALKGMGRLFAFPNEAIGVIPRNACYVRVRGGTAGLDVSNPPHVVVDASRRFAVFSDEFLMIPPRQIGISGNSQSAIALRALSLYLSSEFVRYHQFFYAPQWGIDETRADLETLKLAPIPIGQLSSSELNDWAELQRELASASEQLFQSSQPTAIDKSRLKRLVTDLNDRVFRLLKLRPAERWLVEDFVHLELELNKGKVSPETARRPSPEEQRTYLTALRDTLDGFLSNERGLRHRIEVLAEGEFALLSVALVQSKTAIAPSVYTADNPSSKDLRIIRDRLRSKHSQWVYFDRSLRIYDTKHGVLYQFKPLHRVHWTRRRAVLDADDMIAETLVEGGVP